jgi:hypothetical protein
VTSDSPLRIYRPEVTSAQDCFNRATECERMGSHAKDRSAKAAFIEYARDAFVSGLPHQEHACETPRHDRRRPR